MVKLPEDDTPTIERVISFLYTGAYTSGHVMPLDSLNSQGDSKSDSEETTIEISAKNDLDVYVAADKFGIKPLKTLAAKRILSWGRDHYDKSHTIEILRYAASKINQFPSMTHELHEALAEVTAMHLLDLNTHPDFSDILRSSGTLASYVISKLIEKNVIYSNYGGSYYGCTGRLF